MQGKQQCRCVVWISSWILQIHCKQRVSLGANHLVLKAWIEIDYTVLQKRYVIWYRFCILGKNSAIPFEVNQLLFPDPVFPKMKIICFWFQTMKKDWLRRKVFERFITILNVSVDIIQVLLFQVLSIFEKLHSKFKSFFIKELKIPE